VNQATGRSVHLGDFGPSAEVVRLGDRRLTLDSQLRIHNSDFMNKPLTIAIDGPSGAGKGTVARAVAQRLQYRHVDTGAMYRAVAWKALHDRVDLAHEPDVAAVAERATFDLEGGRVIIDGHDVARAIRTPQIDAAATTVARYSAVRRTLVDRQRAMGAGGGVVMEGRDIGTVVFPAADVKVYLDASPEERARRRASDPAHTASRVGSAVHDIATALEERDRTDRTRAASPLAIADDAVVIDTTGMSITDVVERVLEVVRSKTGSSVPR
jgi:CMP/dCMP kinase